MRSLLALGSLVVALPAFAQAPKLSPFTAPGDGYTIAMPAKPRLLTQATSGVTTHIYMAQTVPMACFTSKSSLPKSFDATNRQTMRKAMLESMLRTSGSTATRTRTAIHAGISGQQTDFTVANGGSGSVWIAETPNAIYMIMGVGRTPAAKAQVEPFLASFRLK